MQVWTREKLTKAANLYKLGIEPKAISAEIGVPLNRLIWTIDYRKDLFGDSRPKAVSKSRPALPAPQRDPVTIGRSLVELAAVPERRTGYVAGIDCFLPPPAAPVGRPVSLLEMTSRHCKWPLNMDGSTNKLFCGDAAEAGRSWCAHHASRVREKPADKGEGGAA